MSRTSTEKSLASQIAAAASWSRTADPAARTAAARAALQLRFETEVDPNGDLDPAERSRRAAYLRRAHYQRLQLQSMRSRRLAAELLAKAETAEAELQAGGDPDAA